MTPRTVLEARVVTGEGGGPDKTILNTPRFMAERGFPSVCVYLRPPKDSGFAALEEKAKRWNAPLEAVDDNGPLDLGVIGRLRSVCERHQPAIWHGHDYKTNFLGLWLARKRPMTLITTLHGWVKNTWKTPLYYAIDRRCIKRYAAVMAVSQDLFDAALACGTPKDRCFLLPNAIDVEEFRRTQSIEEAKVKRGVDPHRFLVGAAGRLSPEKGFDLLIQSVKSLADGGLNVELHIAGEGDDRPRLERLIQNLQIADRVNLLGYQARLHDCFESLNVFALSSFREGLPNVVLEAMAFGVPVVATNIAGVPFVVKEGLTGLLVEPNSQAALTAGIQRMAENIEARRRMGEECRKLMEAEFSFATRMDRMKAIYDLTLEREGRR